MSVCTHVHPQFYIFVNKAHNQAYPFQTMKLPGRGGQRTNKHLQDHVQTSAQCNRKVDKQTHSLLAVIRTTPFNSLPYHPVPFPPTPPPTHTHSTLPQPPPPSLSTSTIPPPSLPLPDRDQRLSSQLPTPSSATDPRPLPTARSTISPISAKANVQRTVRGSGLAQREEEEEGRGGAFSSTQVRTTKIQLQAVDATIWSLDPKDRKRRAKRWPGLL